MRKVVSYRQKLKELARIYKIDKVLDPNLKLTTYEIELKLLKNKVPIPSRRGYFSHKIINEIYHPTCFYLKEKLTIDFSINKSLKKQFNKISSSFKVNLSINLNLNKIFKIIFSKTNNYIKFIIFNIENFFKVITKTIIDSLNNIYHFKYEEKFVKKIIQGGAYSFLVLMIISSGFYIKNFITDVDGLKISLEIKSDKKENSKDIKKKRNSKKTKD